MSPLSAVETPGGICRLGTAKRSSSGHDSKAPNAFPVERLTNLVSLPPHFTHILSKFMPSTSQIQVFVTGGTFDKEYNYLTGELYFKDTHVKEMLERGRCEVPVDIKTLMMVDSLEIGDDELSIIIFNCRKTEATRILITHGTDRMVETARALAEANIEGKTIVLTGAMIPYAFGMSSDGFFNLGSALAFVQVLPPGVYIAMNGRHFYWNNVRKNRQTGSFEELAAAQG